MERFLIKLPKIGTTEKDSASSSKESEAEEKDIINNKELEETEATESDSDEEEVLLPKKRKIYKQKFKEQWTESFEWLKNVKGGNYCEVCLTFIEGGSFHIKRHGLAKAHMRKLRAAKSSKKVEQFINETSSEYKTYQLVKEAELKISAYLCQKNLPFLLADSLPQLFADMFPDSQIASSLKIKRKKATQITVGSLAPYAVEKLVSDLRSIPFSIMIDESTDVTTKKSLVVIVRYWRNGQARDRFFDLLEVEDCTAKGLFNTIKENLLDKFGISYGNIIGFAADNANVMMGNISGVQTLFKNICPDIVIIGCTCHSLHLCASFAAKKLPSSVEQLVRDIYNYFSNSPKRLVELKECQIFAEEQPTKLLQPSQTRWLSLKMVIDRVLQHWNSLILFFQRATLEDNMPAAKGILNALNNKIFKCYFLFLGYILEIVTKLNLEFQSQAPKLPFLLERVTSLYKTVIKSFIKKDILTLNIHNLNNLNISNPRNYKRLEDIYFGANVELLLKETPDIDKQDIHTFQIRALDFYVELCAQIKKRFNFNDKHLTYAANFTPEKALSGDIFSISEYKILFPKIKADVEMVNTEWQLLSEMQDWKKYSNNDLQEFWTAVEKQKNGMGQPMFPNLMEVVKYVSTLPHASAPCERLFSELGLIKTSLRNKLLTTTCSSILHVKDQLNNGGFDYKVLRNKNVNANLVVPEGEVF